MPAFKFKLPIEQGATYHKIFLFSSKSGAPIDFTACKGRMQIRPDVKSSTVLMDLTTENGGIILTAQGAIGITMTAVQTEAITWSGGVYDLEVEFADGKVFRKLQGSVSVSPGVTRA